MSMLRDEYHILTGSPEQIRGQVRELDRVASKMTSVATRLRQLSIEGVWESDAGRTFSSEIGSTPSGLEQIADRLAGAADAMRPYATMLQTSQRVMKKHERNAVSAAAIMREKDRSLEAMTPDDPERPRVLRERLEAVRDLNSAEQQFSREGKGAYDDEQRVAAKLSDIAVPLTDPKGYDVFEALENLGRAANSVGLVGVVSKKVAKPIDIVGAGEPVGKAGRRLFYEEGSWTGVASSGWTYGTDVASMGVSRWVKGTGKAANLSSGVSRLDELPSKPKHVNNNPIAQAPPFAGVPSTRTWMTREIRDKAATTAKEKSGVKDLHDAFSDWEAVAGRGRVAKAGVVIDYSAKAGNRTAQNVSTAKGAIQATGLDQKENERRRKARSDEADRRARSRRFGEGLPEDPRERKMF